MDSDLTFITNEPFRTLKDRFQVLIKDSRLFDCLVGYFYTSEFYSIYKSLVKTEKIRILIGISTSKETYDLLKSGLNERQPLYKFKRDCIENSLYGVDIDPGACKIAKLYPIVDEEDITQIKPLGKKL